MVERVLLTGPMLVLLRLQHDAVLYLVWRTRRFCSSICTARRCRCARPPAYGNAVACDQLRVGRARKAVDVRGVYYGPDTVQRKATLLLAGVTHPLVLGRKILDNDVLVSPIVHCLPHFLEAATAFVQNETNGVEILAGLQYLCRPAYRGTQASSSLGVAV